MILAQILYFELFNPDFFSKNLDIIFIFVLVYKIIVNFIILNL